MSLSWYKTSDREKGFTLLELMMAVAVFGFLMLYISQFMRSEIHLFGDASKQNDVEQKTRQAMMHILDEIRLHPATLYYAGDPQGNDSGVYYTPPGTFSSICVIDVTPSDVNNLPAGTVIYLERNAGKLFYKDANNATYLIADWIDSINLSLDGGGSRLLKIDIKVSNPQDHSQSYELVSWSRLY